MKQGRKALSTLYGRYDWWFGGIAFSNPCFLPGQVQIFDATLRRSKKWGIALSNDFPEKIRIFDTTLRDGEQNPGVSPNPEKKLRTSKRLDDTITEDSRSKNLLKENGVHSKGVSLSDGGQELEGSLPRLKATSEQLLREAQLTNPPKIFVVKNIRSQIVSSLSEVLSSG